MFVRRRFRAPRGPRFEPLESRRLFAACYSLIDLGTLGGDQSEAYDLNDASQVVGFARDASGADRAFVFSDANGNGVADPGEMVNLGVLRGDAASYAYGVSEGGTVVGTSRSAPLATDGDERAVRFNPGAAPADLGLGQGSNGFSSNGGDVNDAGTIVGGALSGLNYRPFVRSAAGTVTTFTLPAPYNFTGEAHAINASGVIVGYSGGFAGDSGFIRSADGTIIAVGHPNPSLPYSYAWAVSDTGFVAGEGFTSTGDYRAFRYEAATGETIDLGTLSGFGSSEGYGVNDAGDVVGRVEPVEGASGPTRAFVYQNGELRDLNTLIAAGTGWTLTEARAINDGGAIAGLGTAPGGATRAFLLVPRPPVVGRYVFYNNSAFDGRDVAANAADDAAIAPDKAALLPRENASFASATSYTRGINGVMIDMTCLGGDLAPEDFRLRRDNNNLFDDWSAVPDPTITVRRGAGQGGSDRVTLTWPDGEIRNEWLSVTILPGPRTGLSEPDTFYFGNSVGETGDPGRTETILTVNALDLIATRRALGTSPAALTDVHDFNRDGRVNALDMAAVRSNYNSILILIRPPAPAGAASEAHDELAAVLA
jgi:probable HAF family extracellular repeat protein